MKGRQFLKMIGAPMCIAAVVVLGCSEEGSPNTAEEGGQRAQESGSVATGEEARDGNTQPTREAEETFVEDPGVTETTHPVWACGLSFGTSVESDYRRFLRWGAKGDVIVFTYQSRVVILETATGRLRTVADEPWSNASFHVDILPQGEKLVATTCGFGEESSEEAEDYGGAIRRGHDNYEIATIDLHGRVERLTTTDNFEHFPVWSPDGQRIAYVSKEQGIYRGTWGIFTMAADGSDVRKVTSGPDGPFFSPYVIGLGPPTWSPDGRTLTYVTRPLSGPMALRILYAETVDGGEVWRSRTLAEDLGIGPVSWSPDGQQLVFGRSSLEESGLYVSSPDGSEMRLLFEGPEGTRSNRPAFRVSWSPDGEEILFAVGYEFPGPTQRPDRLDSFGSEAVTDVTLHAIRPDGSGLREIALGSPIAVWEVAWSPDGAEIAVLGMSDKELFLVTLPRGASSRQDPGGPHPRSRPRRAPRAGIAPRMVPGRGRTATGPRTGTRVLFGRRGGARTGGEPRSGCRLRDPCCSQGHPCRGCHVALGGRSRERVGRRDRWGLTAPRAWGRSSRLDADRNDSPRARQALRSAKPGPLPERPHGETSTGTG